ncbi:MAG: DUF3048 domain-containing protein [Anaerolineaceae bacterium]|nr:DUF3048 domain-containing protein [Anaerolineaceae bacterium]
MKKDINIKLRSQLMKRSLKSAFSTLLAIAFLAGCMPAAVSIPPVSTTSAPPTPAVTNTVKVITLEPTRTQEPTSFTVSVTRTPAPSPTSEATASAYGYFNFPPGVDSLTGLPAVKPENLNQMPVLVKISNFPRYSRPQAGLSFADWVFEYYIGFDVNRYLAIFYGNDSPEAGPIRSGRLVDAQLADMYPGYLVYGNADPQVDLQLENHLGKRILPTKYAKCPPVCGDDTHSIAGVFADTAGVRKFMSEDNALPNKFSGFQGMVFDALAPKSDRIANQIAVNYGKENRGEWRYDAQSGKYLQWIETGEYKDGKLEMIPHTDRVNQQQLAISNIVILFADYIQYAPSLHDVRIWENTKGERAVFFRDGVMSEGTWRTTAQNKPIQLSNQFNMPYSLKPGNTWVVIASLQSPLEEPVPTNYELNFYLPYN